ncbi:MAG: hypothetical protein WC389_11765 [Lutibacter sp.]|jgi:hypothetical protein
MKISRLIKRFLKKVGLVTLGDYQTLEKAYEGYSVALSKALENKALLSFVIFDAGLQFPDTSKGWVLPHPEIENYPSPVELITGK